MIEVCLSGHAFEYEVKDIVSLFYSEPIVFNPSKTPFLKERGLIIFSIIEEAGEEIESITRVEGKDISFEFKSKAKIPKTPMLKKRVIRRMVKLGILNVLEEFESRKIPWGILTGIRPTKIIRELEDRGFNDKSIPEKLEQEFGISPEKANLMLQVSRNEKSFLNRDDSNKISIYLGVPFCPDKCLYCSFMTNPIKGFQHLVLPYMEAVKKEIDLVGKMLNQRNWEIETLYVGGGTPTSLGNVLLEELMLSMDKAFKLGHIKEITVEAGRPDTLDYEKIRILKKFGANRISINPQTMNELTLELIGRKHNAESIQKAFELARKAGFNNINMDIIAGLPGENFDMFDYTIEKIRELSPDSITVHTLALKKGANLVRKKNSYFLPDEDTVQKMLENCRQKTTQMDMIPYYLYRQKNMIGLQENVGYSLPGKECIYNIKMIEEVQNIIALGPGGVSRIMDFETKKINKIYNDRSTEGYISRIDEMIERKKEAIKNKT
ncbi:MAG: coproporphyrinogen dehydrogenase HemZ [Deltaproteobacteria bacterium]